MKKPKTPTPTTAACYNCQRVNALFVLPQVRRTKCNGCGAVHPSLTAGAVAEFINAGKYVPASV